MIKFRAHLYDALQRGWMEEGSNYFYQENQYLSSFLTRIYMAYEGSHPAHIPFEVEDRLDQWMGKKDKNGKDIYVNDEVILKSGVKTFIIFVDGRFTTEHEDGLERLECNWWETVEVTGCIRDEFKEVKDYENKKL